MLLEVPVSAHGGWEGNLAYPLQIHDRSDLTFLLTEDEIIWKERNATMGPMMSPMMSEPFQKGLIALSDIAKSPPDFVFP